MKIYERILSYVILKTMIYILCCAPTSTHDAALCMGPFLVFDIGLYYCECARFYA